MDWTKVSDAVAHFSSHDPRLERLGAARHHYGFRPRLTHDKLAQIEARLGYALPGDYRSFVTVVGDGGAGPFHGVLPLDAASQWTHGAGTFPARLAWNVARDGPGRAAFMGRSSEAGTIGLSHMGCGYFAVLIGAGPARGQVWGDFRGIDEGYRPLYPTFTAFYAEWLRVLVEGGAMSTGLSAYACGLPHALDAFLRDGADRLGKTPESLSEAETRAVLEGIGDGAIAFSASGPEVLRYFDEGDRMDMCPSCRGVSEYFLAGRGLRRPQLAPGRGTRMEREAREACAA